MYIGLMSSRVPSSLHNCPPPASRAARPGPHITPVLWAVWRPGSRDLASSRNQATDGSLLGAGAG